jgi:hypothetical protein
MVMALFHYQIGFPNVKVPAGRFKLRYSGHAIKAAREDRYGNFLNYIPQSLDVNQASLIEMEYTNKRIVKLVYRLSLTKGFDIVIVVVPTEYPWAVKTVFINERGDKHSTLNRSKYTIPSLA